MPVAAFSNTWQLYCFKLFKVALDHLEQCVAELAQQHPVQYRTHPKTRLLASIYKCMTQLVPANPDHPDFRLGKTLGKRYSNWRRVKKGMPDRYRLFFRFASSPVRLIVYVWFNDEDTLRKAGSKTDVYEAFKRLLARGEVPATINDLVAESEKI